MFENGPVAQLGAHHIRIVGVVGSNPIRSTKGGLGSSRLFMEVVMEITISQLEAYLQDRYNGWTTEQGLFMKLVEEMGEIAEVLNKRSGAKAAGAEDLQNELGKELADLIHYAVAIAAITGIDLTSTMLEKDRLASMKYHHDTNLETFLRNQKK